MAIRFSWIAGLAVLAGCAGDGGPDRSPDYNWDSAGDADSAGAAIKISYLRFDMAPDAPGQKGGRWIHTYKYTLSRGWMIKRGDSPREPFERIWKRSAYIGENIHEARMMEVVRKLDDVGIRELKETPLTAINLESLRRIEQANDAEAAKKTRIITVETDNYRRTVTSYDNGDPGSFKRFTAVEREVIKWLYANTVMVSKESQSTMPKGKN